MREIYIKSKAGLLPIGRRGENLATRVIYPGVPEEGQSVAVFVLRNGDSASYPASNIEITDTEIIWTVTSVDTGKSGRGKVQYKFSDSVTGEVIKTEIYGFLVGLAIDTEVGPAPDPYETWLDSLTELAGQAQVAVREAEDYAESASESADSASESAQSAEQSATQANTYATNAHTSATSATASEASARQSAISAEASAESAQASAESAGASATAAEESAESASASAESASESKTAAETARQQAYESVQSSQTYSGQSQGYASQAATSATSAGQSATAASASATSASQSAGTATTKAAEASASATTATTKASEASASATAAQEAQTGAETAQAGAESAAQTAQAGADAVGLLREQIYNSYPNVVAEAGPIVSISDGADGIPVKSLVVGIEPVQAGSGDPGPDNVRPITGWTGAEVKRTGINVWDEEWEVGNWSTADGTAGKLTDRIRSKNAIPVLPNTTYYFNVPSYGARVYMYDANGEYIGQIFNNAFTSRALTTAPDCYYLRFNTTAPYGVTYNHDISINCPATDTSYHSYQGETYPITFPSEAGTVYGGSLDATSGVLTVDRAQIASYAGETLPGEWISDRDVYTEGATPTTGAQVVYELATPVTYQLTPTEVQTLLGTNNIWADTGDVQEMAYRADTKLYIDEVFEDYQDDLADYADALAALG